MNLYGIATLFLLKDAMKPKSPLRNVAIVVELFNKFGSDIFAGIGQYIYEHPHWRTRHLDFVMESNPPDWLETWRGDGIIVRDRMGKSCLKALKTGAKIVDLSIIRHPEVPTIYTDQFLAIQQVVDHLRERFFSNLAFVSIRGVPFCDKRRNAFQEIAGKFCPVFEFPFDPTEKEKIPASSSRDWNHWLLSLPKPVGIVTCYDPIGLKVLETCNRLKIAVPTSIAVVGINNDETYCQFAKPPMSSVAQNGHQTGYQACKLLESLMDGNPPPSPIVVPTLGVTVRRSTEVLAISDPILLRAVQFLRRNACFGLDVADVANEVGCCRRTLERRFQKVLNHSILDEIQHVRFQKICELLTHSDLTLEFIAERVGIHSLTHFHNFFKKYAGITPNEYRKRSRGNL